MGLNYSSISLPKDLIVRILLSIDAEDVFGVFYDHRLRMLPFFWRHKTVIQEHVRAEYWKRVKQYIKDHGDGKLNQYHFCRLMDGFGYDLKFLIDGKHCNYEIDLVADTRGRPRPSDHDVLFNIAKTVLLVEISYGYPQKLMFEITKVYIRETGFMVLTGIKL